MNRKEFTDNFSKLIKIMRIERGLTQKQLAEKCGLTANWISHYESGRRLPNLFIFSRIVEALDTEASMLLKL